MSDRYPIAASKIVATVAALLELQGQRQLGEVLRAADARIDTTDYDNWNGGTSYYSLRLELPVAQYAKIETDIAEIERTITAKLETALRDQGGDVLNSVVITPAFEDADTTDAIDEDGSRIWEAGKFRLFLSHVSAHKVAVTSLKRELHLLGVSGFLAHEDIEPSLDWQGEIELALRSMNAMAALLTPDFHASNWTDQEIGAAFGRGIFVLPVRLPINPYGFIAKTQGLAGDLAKPTIMASAIVGILLKRPRTDAPMREALVVALEQSQSFSASKLVAAKVDSTTGFDPDQLTRIETSIASNSEVGNAFGVPDRLRRYVASHRRGP